MTMSGTWAVAAKEFRHMRHDRLTLVLTFALPVFQLLLYGFVLETRVHNIPAALVNHDRHQPARLLEQRISQSPLFSIKPEYTERSAIESAMRSGALRVAIEIPEDYSSTLLATGAAKLQVQVDGVEVATANFAMVALEALATQDFRSTGQAPLQPRADIEAKVLFNREGGSAAFFLPGLLAVLVQTITTLLLILSITTERERGTLEQLLVTELRPDAILAGKCLAIGIVGLLECLLLAAFMRFLFHLEIQSGVVLFLAVLPLFVLGPLGLGLFIAALARNQVQALQFAQVVFLPSVMLSGFLFPREFLNSPFAVVSNLLPTSYLVSLSRSLILRGASFREAGPDILASAVFTIVLAAAGWWTMRRSFAR